MKKSVTLSALIIAIFFFSSSITGSLVESSSKSIEARVLILHSYHYGFTWTEKLSEGIKSVFSEYEGLIELRFEFMDSRYIFSAEYFSVYEEMLKVKYAEQKIDVIICCDDRSLDFYLRRGKEIFPETPTIFCSVSGQSAAEMKEENLTGIMEELEIRNTLELALKFHPNVKKVAVVTDMTLTGQALKANAAKIFDNYKERLEFRYLDDLTREELIEEISQLTEGTLVFLFIFHKDSKGRLFSHEYNLKVLRNNCRVPIYSVWEFYLGYGIVGGKLTDGELEGRLIGETAMEIIRGRKAENIPMKSNPTRYMFDFNELQRFNVKLNELPKGSVVINKPFSFYGEYKRIIWVVVFVFFILLFVIATLIYVLNLRRKTERKINRICEELKLERDERTSQLQTANEDLKAYAYTVSHDLKKPLRHISAYITFLEQTLPEDCDPKSREYLQSMSDAVRNMQRMIDVLLEFARSGSSELSKKSVDLSKIVQAARQEVTHVEDSRIIEWKIPELPVVQGDPELLKLALVNLISNALKFTKTRKTAEIEIGSFNRDNEVVIFIRDNGVGFDMKYSDKLFTIFQRLHGEKEFSGTGIGLANVKRIVKRHSGETWAEGEVDKGAVFYFSLPMEK